MQRRKIVCEVRIISGRREAMNTERANWIWWRPWTSEPHSAFMAYVRPAPLEDILCIQKGRQTGRNNTVRYNGRVLHHSRNNSSGQLMC